MENKLEDFYNTNFKKSFDVEFEELTTETKNDILNSFNFQYYNLGIALNELGKEVNIVAKKVKDFTKSLPFNLKKWIKNKF